MMQPLWVRPSYFAWLIVPAALLGAHFAYGVPHVIWTRTWIETGHGYEPWAPRTYTRCTYLGPYGTVSAAPVEGACVWVAFFKAPAEQAQ